MPQTLEFHLDEQLPRLAWALRYKPGQKTVHVAHGPWVDTRPSFFVEGAWNGPFEQGRFDRSLSFMGSGARLDQGRLQIVAPCHTCEAIYGAWHDDAWVWSNSLVFLLAAINDEPDPDYPDYEADVDSITDGIHHYKRHLHMHRGSIVRLLYLRNLVIEPDGTICENDKPQPPAFPDYNAYIAFLREELCGLYGNAQDRRRTRYFQMLATASNGYDSPACAALAREIGCEHVLVFESDRTARSDSGEALTKQIGYQHIHRFRGNDYKKLECADEFCATGDMGRAISTAAATNHLEGVLLLSGNHGDRAWEKHLSPQERDLRHVTPHTNVPKNEFRLRLGFINVLPAFIGALNVHDLTTIANSHEMEPWSIGGDYDRPIPRRFLEEKGVPREAFGMEKGGGALNSLRYGTLLSLRRLMPPQDYARFRAYLRTQRPIRRLKHPLRCLAYLLVMAHPILKKTLGFKALNRWLRIKHWPRRYQTSPFAPSFLFPWAVAELKPRYQQAAELLTRPDGSPAPATNSQPPGSPGSPTPTTSPTFTPH